ncbi:MAG: AhpC/TSA family protein [Rhodospirillaceae bacterium]|jgi:peroxiredoxin|nr:AhpC/TSA family protein [Verrucomicrobiota bacterium]MBT6203376.1 AhpC/TSA family protein [Rhodospirillaceae bacterium]MBT7613693.1 AhpC/TSA family protein [Rhodospirillaceae bacterium]
MSLQAALAAVENAMPPEKRDMIAGMVGRIAAGDAGTKSLAKGDQAPNFILSDAHGNATALRAVLMEGPIVLVFYRGRWCPYCSAELAAYQLAMPEITARGAKLVAISPEIPDDPLTPGEIDSLSFEVLSDPGNTVARKFGLVYEVDSDTRSEFEGLGLDLSKVNGDERWELPVPATFIVDSNREIVFASTEPDYRTRAEPADVVAALDHMAGRDG